MQRRQEIPQPFLKWAGGKRQLLPVLAQHLPKRFHNYHEPFLGGGALFFWLYRHGLVIKAFLSDINAELIDTYRAIRDNPKGVLELLKSYPYDEEFFYKLRRCNPNKLSLVERAARMIYLNKTCYNGLYRVNKDGQFNVPFGRYRNPKYYDYENIMAVSRALRKAVLECASFEIVLENAQPGDLVYFDPPYIPRSATSNFTSYSKDGFSHSDQVKLRDICIELTKKGVNILLSNSYTQITLELYNDDIFFVHEVHANRFINSNSKKRGKIKEVIITNYPVYCYNQLQLLERNAKYAVTDGKRSYVRLNKSPGSQP